jgi:hypothetical protein
MIGLATIGWLAGGGGTGGLHFALLRQQARAITSSPGRGRSALALRVREVPQTRQSVAAAPPSPAAPRATASPRGSGKVWAVLAPLRLAVTASVLFLAATHGPLPLFLTVAGILLARALVLRWVR